MKNLRIKSLLVAAALVCQSIVAETTNEKGRTYVLPVNVCASTAPLKNVDRLAQMEKDDDKLGLTVAAWAAYQQACEKRSGAELAKGLMNGAKAEIKLYGGAANSSNGDVMLQKMFIPAGVKAAGHAPDAPTAAWNAKLANYDDAQNATITLSKLEHKRVVGGVNLCYDASKLYEGLLLGADVSFVWERNKLTVDATGTTAPAHLVDPATAVINMLKGNAPEAKLQAVPKINSLKIDKDNVSSRGAINEAVLCAGLKVVDNETAELCFAILGSIPGGQERKTDFLFAANPGERQFKLGLKGNALLKLVCEDDYKIDLHAGGSWKYAFKKSKEKLVPQAKNNVWAQYQLASKNYGTEIVPLVNLLEGVTTDLGGASEFAGWARLAFEKGSFGGSVGYNLCFVQEKKLTYTDFPKETIYLADAIAFGASAEDGVGIVVVPLKFAADSSLLNTSYLLSGTKKTLALTDLVEEEPSKLTHNISAEANYTFCGWEYPILVGAGAAYQWSRDRAFTPEYWTVGVRGGVSF